MGGSLLQTLRFQQFIVCPPTRLGKLFQGDSVSTATAVCSGYFGESLEKLDNGLICCLILLD